MVKEPDGSRSYIPYTYLERDKHPFVTDFTYLFSVVYLLPIIQYLVNLILKWTGATRLRNEIFNKESKNKKLDGLGPLIMTWLNLNNIKMGIIHKLFQSPMIIDEE